MGRLQAAARWVRIHWLFVTIFAAGAALRVITQLAYRPALIFYDSPGYLVNTSSLVPGGTRPLGYPLFLKLVLLLNDLSWVPLFQHLMGLAAGLLWYAMLLRLGLWRWLAALAAAAVLLDGYQLDIEQWVLSDTLFELLLVGGYAILLWRRHPPWPAYAAAGALLGLAVWVRFGGAVMVVPAAIYALLNEVGVRRRILTAAMVATAFAVPVLGYMSWFDAEHGRFGLSDSSARFLYGRVATFADCDSLDLPQDEQALCPHEPRNQRLPTNCYVWCKFSPYAEYTAPPGKDKDAIVRRFAKRVILHQPGDYATVMGKDFLRGFEWRRRNGLDAIGSRYWRFTVEYPFQFANKGEPEQMIREFGGTSPTTHPSLTRFLRAYQQIAYVRGPFLALSLVLGLLAALGLGRARRSGLRAAALVLVLGGICVTLPSYMVTQFSWRYQLPLVIFYPAAGAVGLFALAAKRRPGSADESAVAFPSSTDEFRAPPRSTRRAATTREEEP